MLRKMGLTVILPCSGTMRWLGFILVALLTASRCNSQTIRSSAESLPEGVIKALAVNAKQYCEDQFAEGFRKGCRKKFETHLRWRELSITPSGESAILVENDNTGYCGSGGCALYLFVQCKGGRFTQVLDSEGGLGMLERVTVLKTITNGHFDIRVTWSVSKGHSVYQWDGSQYSE